MTAMSMTVNIIDLFHAREEAQDWGAWEKAYPRGASLLGWASEEFRKSEWQNESR